MLDGHQTGAAIISIHAPRVGSDYDHCSIHYNGRISIHAPRVGSDPKVREDPRDQRNFNPRSPCGERQTSGESRWSQPIFQSTLPVWGATADPNMEAKSPEISIHAPRVGSDTAASSPSGCQTISIHAPRVGSDGGYARSASHPGDFNPRSPCGERLSGTSWWSWPGNFNPRSPCGERLFSGDKHFAIIRISIHAPRVGSDSKTAQILLEILSHLNSFAPSEKKKIPFHRKEQGKFIEIF